jgi:hypothetical protein
VREGGARVSVAVIVVAVVVVVFVFCGVEGLVMLGVGAFVVNLLLDSLRETKMERKWRDRSV